jgi:predicted transcriptional regulator
VANKNAGDMMRARREENRKRVAEYFSLHPFSTQKDCARDLGLTKQTVNRHVSDLRNMMGKRKK